MTKAELIEAVALRLGGTRNEASRAVTAVVDAIVHGVSKEEKVSIAGFGTFRKKKRKARTTRNPRTRELIEVKPSTTLGFTPSESLRNGV